MAVMNSITYRITGLTFLLVGITVATLLFLANQQMTGLFQEYVNSHNMMNAAGDMMGMQETEFLASVHQSLIWVGAAILACGFVASYALARSITVPIRQLSAALSDIEKGHLGKKVHVDSDTELGQLAEMFNHMSATLEANNRLRRRFLADIAHELKTPLAVVQGHLEGMLEGVVAMNKEQIGSLYDETVHLNRLIKDLRDLSLAEAGQLQLEVQTIDVNQQMMKVLNMLAPLADEKNICLQHFLQSVPAISFDMGRMNQVLYNLLTNALRHTPENGRIEVATSVAAKWGKKWVEIVVSDSGEGIPSKDLPFIFEHFYRADTSRDRKSGGSGIGLAIVKQLVEVHGGKVDVQSREGEGSRFYIYVPFSEKSREAHKLQYS